MAAPKIADVKATGLFLKKNWQIIYAALLIVLVPITIMMNSFFVIGRFRKTVDVQLQRTALIIGKMFDATSSSLYSQPEKLQERLEKVAAVIPEVKMLDILTLEGNDFKVVASLYKDGLGRLAHGRQNMLAWYDGEAIAFLTKSSRSAAVDDTLTAEEARGSERFWGVVMPLKDEKGQVAYLLSAKISLNIIDQLVMDNLFWSYVWLALTVLIIILILASNTRLFEYAMLFKKLKEVDKMKDDFISMASHELRAPITAVRGYLSLFLEDAFGKLDDKPKGILRITFNIATHMAGLVEDLLDASRIDQGRMQFNFEQLPVEDTIQEIVEQLHFEAEKKKLAFEFKRPAEPLPKISLDKARIKQVLINICSNAIKYTPSGSVTVTAEVKEGKSVEIKVMDTGLGMSAEARERLFQKFYRVKTTETRDIPGTGLGLWITKQIVELMKGKIFVDSIEKVGTQVSITFPVAEQPAPPPAAPAASSGTAEPKAPADKPAA